MTANYIMGYVQVFLLRNFEETEKIGKYEVIAIFGCSIVYCIVSWLGNWFDHSVGVTIGFMAYVIFAYYCMIFVYYAKRHIDTELLNDDLEAFKKREGHSDEK